MIMTVCSCISCSGERTMTIRDKGIGNEREAGIKRRTEVVTERVYTLKKNDLFLWR